MNLNWPKKILNSVFTKMVVIILIAGIGVNVALWGFFWAYRAMAGRPFQKNIHQYLNYVIDDLGVPPSQEHAEMLARKAAFQIHYSGSDGSWSTSMAPIDLHRVHFRTWDDDPNIRGGMSRGRFFVEIYREKNKFLFEFSGEYKKNPTLRRVHGLMVLSTILILAAAYLVIRRILKPVRLLDIGVKMVGQGNLNHQVPVTKSDELGQLSKAFNNMTRRLSEMLAAKEQLLRDVSHELRSPLTRMKVALEFVNQDDARELLTSDIREMEQLIAQILDTARADHQNSHLYHRDTDVVELLKQVIADYQKQSADILFNDGKLSAVCEVDSGKIKIVLKNVLDNALKYSLEDSDPVEVSINKKDNWILIEIKDNGIGIDPEDLKYIWEPFFRADKSRSRDTGGYGLGLSLCKRIMEAHGGRIEIHSVPDKGTTVYLWLPLQINRY